MNALTVQDDRIDDAVEERTALYVLTDRLYRARSETDVFAAALDAIRATLGCERASILLFDPQGVMRFAAWKGISDDYRTALEGHSPWKAGDRNPVPIFVEDISDTSEPDWIKQRIRDEGICGLAFIPLVIEDKCVGKFMTYYSAPHVFTKHEIEVATTIARQLGFSLERSFADQARRVAEGELRESEERFRTMAEHAPVMIWTSDAEGRCTNLNAMLREFWGVDDKDLSEFDWQTTMHPDDAVDIGKQMADAIGRRSRVSIQGRYRNAGGDYRIMRTDARPQFSAQGKFKGMIGVNVDVTERRQSEMQRELLLAELNHRVKNTLAVVQSIAHQTFRGVEDLDHEKSAFEGRLLALAGAHNLLTQTSWKSAALEDLISDALQSRGTFAQRVDLSGPMVLLRPKETLSIALAMHELMTNAVKYGALSNDKGQIIVNWGSSGAENRLLRLTWREVGGPVVAPPRERGFGTRLVERILAQELEGDVTMDFRPEGLVCTIQAPMPDLGEANL